MRYRTFLTMAMFVLFELMHAQTDSSYGNKVSSQNFLIGTLKIASQTTCGLGTGILGFNSFQKAHEKISPVAVTGWVVGSSVGVSLLGKIFYGEYNYLSVLSGSIIGGVILFPSIRSGSGYYILTGSLIGEIIAFHLALDTPETKNQSAIQLFPKSFGHSTIGEYSIHLIQVTF